MEELEKEFIPYDRALKMKALGFDEPCLGYYAKYNDDTRPPRLSFNLPKHLKSNSHLKYLETLPSGEGLFIGINEGGCAAPTFSQAINFLYICSNKQIDIELKASDTYEERLRKIDQGCEDLWNLQNSKSN